MNTLKRLFSYVKPYRRRFTGSMILAVLYTLARASQPFFIGLAISELARNVAHRVSTGTGGVNFPYIGFIVGALVVTGVIDAVGEYYSRHLLANVVQSTMKDIRTDINHKINRMPVSYFDGHQQGDILSRLTNDVDSVSNAMQQGVLPILGAVLTLFFSAVFMFYLSPFFALIALLMYPVSFYVYRIFLRKSQPKFQRLQDVLGDLNGFIQEYYTGYSVVKLFGQQENITQQFKEITDDLNDTAFQSNFASSSINPILSAITHFFYIGLFLSMALTLLGGPLVAGPFVLARQLEIGGLQSFIQYVWQASGPISDVTQLSGNFQAAAASLNRVFELLDEKEEPEETDHDVDLKTIKGRVAFEGVDFGYDPDHLLMKNMSFSVEPGETVAIVGPTGAGKTTLINLLMRFYEVNAGRITIDGIPLTQLSRRQVRHLFGMVLQDPWLYHASIADNIGFGRLDATRAEIVTAAKTANVDHFVRTMPDGYDTMINKESSNVSQGQKQLLTIARVLLREPQIIILDEATSSVDTRLELHIQRAMNKAMENRTSFIIAHRLSTIRDADLILVMDHGNIVEKGTHHQLLEQQGMYKELYESQFTEDE